MDRILASGKFASAPHLCRFLRFVVEQTLAGNSEGLKETVLGQEALGRGPAFDPRVDPIVRVQAGKLRTRLKDYYESEGATDQVLIELPKGGYVPSFRCREEASPPVSPVALRRPYPKWLSPVLAAVALAGALVIWWRREPDRTITQIAQVTFDTGSTTFPAISRDGRLLAYASDRSEKGDFDIWVQTIGGTEPVPLTRHSASDITPDFSPDGSRVAFRSHRDGGGVYVVSVFGTGERKLASEGWRPRFSPDGSLIVYQGSSRRAGGDLFGVCDVEVGPCEFFFFCGTKPSVDIR